MSVALLFLLVGGGGLSQTSEEQSMAHKYRENFQMFTVVHNEIKDIHPLLETLYPVAIVEDEVFYVFAVEKEGEGYSLIKSARPAMIVPQGVRAAFPLDFLDNQMACVVTGDVFDDLAGYVTIFHEFIHCAQMETCELQLKARLSIAQEAEAAGDYMWELAHPFPYNDPQFEEIYTLFLDRAAAGDRAAVSRCRAFLHEVLNSQDYEYMTWQEWKEGFARYIENKIRRKLDLEERQGALTPPFDRVSFYTGGALYISLLVQEEESLEEDIEALFERLASPLAPHTDSTTLSSDPTISVFHQYLNRGNVGQPFARFF